MSIFDAMGLTFTGSLLLFTAYRIVPELWKWAKSVAQFGARAETLSEEYRRMQAQVELLNKDIARILSRIDVQDELDKLFAEELRRRVLRVQRGLIDEIFDYMVQQTEKQEIPMEESVAARLFREPWEAYLRKWEHTHIDEGNGFFLPMVLDAMDLCRSYTYHTHYQSHIRVWTAVDVSKEDCLFFLAQRRRDFHILFELYFEKECNKRRKL